MAAGKITLQANDGKTLSLVAPEGMEANTSGVVATKSEVDTKAPLASPSFTGTPTINGVAQSGYAGFKNYIINGGFDHWNYATSQIETGYRSADRWFNIHSGSTKTISKQFSEVLSANVMRTTVASVAGATNYVRSIQRIENITKYAGRTITLSFQGQVDTNKNIAISFSSIYGTGGTPSAQEDYGLMLVPLTTVFDKKTVTVTIPSMIGKTLGTDGVHTSYLQVQFWFDAGSGTLASSLGQQSGTFDIAEVQLEEGSVATPFENRHYGLELSLCQRYYEVFNIASANKYGTAGLLVAFNSINPITTKRVLPTITFGTISYTNCSAVSAYPWETGVTTRVTVTAAGAYNASSTSPCSASAEL